MVYEIMARNCSEKNLNAGKIAAILSRAGQIIHRKSIDQREQTGSRRRTPVFSWVDPNWRTYTMATAAQIEANRRNAKRSTGPKTDEGKDRVRRNAFKHGMTARTIMPVLPQEDPKELEDQIQQAITAMKPRNPLELDLVCPRCGWRGSWIAPSGSRRPTWPTGSEWPRGRGRTRSARKSSAGFTTSAASCFFRPR